MQAVFVLITALTAIAAGASQPKEQPKTIVERIGEPAFLEQLAEECSELAQAALKTARKYRGENPTPKTIDDCVMRMKLKKHERWERRLKEVGK